MYVDVLKHLSKQTLPFLFQNTPLESFSLGDRIEFIYHWSKWIASFGEEYENVQEFLSLMPAVTYDFQENSQDTVHSNDTKTCKNSSSSTLCLTNILASNRYGKAVIDYFKIHNQLDDPTRKLIADAVLQFCIAEDIELSTNDAESLSKQIVEVFPTELAVYKINFYDSLAFRSDSHISF